MSEDARPFASLSSSLLARRGAARPAMRPQAIQLASGTQHPLEDLGWNDMGEEASSQVPSPVAAQQAEILRNFSPEQVAPSPFMEPTSAPRVKGKAKAAFTLRLDADRHLKLRLFCAISNRSAQQIVTQALDEFLARNSGQQAHSTTASDHPTTGDFL